MLPFKLEYLKKRDPEVGTRQVVYLLEVNEFAARLTGWVRLRELRGQLADANEWAELSCVDVDLRQWPGETRNPAGVTAVPPPPVEPWRAAEFPEKGDHDDAQA